MGDDHLVPEFLVFDAFCTGSARILGQDMISIAFCEFIKKKKFCMMSVANSCDRNDPCMFPP